MKDIPGQGRRGLHNITKLLLGPQTVEEGLLKQVKEHSNDGLILIYPEPWELELTHDR